MRFLVLADIHGHDPFLRAVLAAEPEWDAAVIVGDITQAGQAGEAAAVLSALTGTGRRVLAVPGNWDRPGVLDFLQKNGMSLHGAGITVGGIGFFGAGASNQTPFHTPFELSEEELERLMIKGYRSVSQAGLKILVSHTPPFRSKLDRIGLGTHVGSEAARRFLKANPVDYCLCGHIHESAGEDTVEEVRCCNPGAVREGRYGVLEVNGGEIEMTIRKVS